MAWWYEVAEQYLDHCQLHTSLVFEWDYISE